MKLLFCHDGPIEKNKEGIFFSTGFNDEVFERYRVITDKISIAMRVHHVSQKNEKENYLRLSSSKYNVVECPDISSIKGILFNRRKCKKILEDNIKNSNVIIVRLPSFIGNQALKIIKKYKKPYLIELVGCPWDSLWNHSLIGKLIAPYMYFITKKNIKNSKYTLYVTDKFLQNRYHTKGKYVGCSDVKIQTNNENLILNRINKNINETKILGTIGVVDVKYKGQEYVIKSIKKLRKMGYDVKYQIVGAGDKTRLEKIAKKNGVLQNVEFIGPLTHDKIFAWLDNIDIYIQPSKTEGMPRALIEAMSRGCPAIGSNVGGIKELLDNEFVFKKGKKKEIIKIFTNFTKEKLIDQSKRNYNYSLNFKEEILSNKRNQFYKEFKESIYKTDW